MSRRVSRREALRVRGNFGRLPVLALALALTWLLVVVLNGCGGGPGSAALTGAESPTGGSSSATRSADADPAASDPAGSGLSSSPSGTSGPSAPLPAPPDPGASGPAGPAPSESSGSGLAPTRPASTLPASTLPASTLPAGLSSRIVLRASEVIVGESLSAVFEVTNGSPGPVSVPAKPGGCRPKWAIGLENDTMSFDPVFTADCGLEPLVFQPGTTELPVTVSTKYTPALPPGEYRVVFVSTDRELPVPAPVSVRVVPR